MQEYWSGVPLPSPITPCTSLLFCFFFVAITDLLDPSEVPLLITLQTPRKSSKDLDHKKPSSTGLPSRCPLLLDVRWVSLFKLGWG